MSVGIAILRVKLGQEKACEGEVEGLITWATSFFSTSLSSVRKSQLEEVATRSFLINWGCNIHWMDSYFEVIMHIRFWICKVEVEVDCLCFAESRVSYQKFAGWIYPEFQVVSAILRLNRNNTWLTPWNLAKKLYPSTVPKSELLNFYGSEANLISRRLSRKKSFSKRTNLLLLRR
jgi:hypothetical protein